MTDYKRNNPKVLLANRLEAILANKHNIESSFSEIQRLLSHLPNTVPELSPDNALEWHETLIMLENLVTVGIASWNSADHYLSNIISRLFREVIKE